MHTEAKMKSNFGELRVAQSRRTPGRVQKPPWNWLNPHAIPRVTAPPFVGPVRDHERSQFSTLSPLTRLNSRTLSVMLSFDCSPPRTSGRFDNQKWLKRSPGFQDRKWCAFSDAHCCIGTGLRQSVSSTSSVMAARRPSRTVGHSAMWAAASSGEPLTLE